MSDKASFYFSHDFNAFSDEKILDLRADHGLEGYGAYWAIIEQLANASGYSLECNYKRIAFHISCSQELVQSIIEDFDLFEVVDGKFNSQSLTKRLLLLDEKRSKNSKAAKERWKKYRKEKENECKPNADAMQTHNECSADAMQIKEIKEIDKVKENKSILSDTGKPETEQKVLGEFKVKGQTETWKLTESYVIELKEAFTGIDIIAECKKAKAWLSANPSKMKTSKGMKKFLFGWIERSNNSGRATFDQSNNGQTKPKSEGTRLYPEVIHEPRPIITDETKEMIDKLFNK